MSNSKFSVGDRVAVYCYVNNLNGRAGKVSGINPDGHLWVDFDKGGFVWTLAAQCRRLKKVAKAPKYYYGIQYKNNPPVALCEYRQEAEDAAERDETIIKLKVVKE